MKKITVPEEFASDMVDFYQSKLDEVEKKADELRTIINELKGIPSNSAAEAEPETKKRGRKPGTKVKKAGRPAGKKSTKSLKLPYEEFIMDNIRSDNKVLTSSQLTDKIISDFNLSGKDAEKAKVGISRYLMVLSKQEGKLETAPIPNARRGYYYGLPEWFENGNLKAQYAV